MLDSQRFELRTNSWMRPLYDALAARQPDPLPKALQQRVTPGLVIADGCVCLKSQISNLARAPEKKPSYREWFSNEIALDSDLGPSDPAWRLQLLSWGTILAQNLLEEAIRLCGDQRMQALLSLQSAPGLEDPEIDFASGSLFFYSVRDAGDDCSVPAYLDNPNALPQPVLTVTHGHALNGL